jgi:MFS transporter, DHA3 family, macrolide efflux protein
MEEKPAPAQKSDSNAGKKSLFRLREFPVDRWQRPFFTLWTVQALSLLGSQLVQFALIWYLTAETGSATVLALASLVGLGPQIFLGPFIGALVDRWNRRLVMMAADAMVALATVVLAVLFATGVVQIWHIFGLIFIRNLAGTFHWPAMTASTSLMVPKEQLSRIQGLNQLLQGGLTILAAPLGALLLGVLPMQGVLAIDILTAVIAIVPLLFIGIPQPKAKPVGADGLRPSVWSDFKAGLRYTAGWPGLLILMVSATLINLVLSTAFTLIPILVTKHFGGGAIQLSIIQSASGVGMLLGGLLLGIWGGFKRRIYTSLAGLLGAGVGAILIGFTPAALFGVAVALFLFVGFTLPIVNGPIHAVMQAVVAPEMQGRIFMLLSSAATAMMPIGLLIAGPVADRFGVQVWFVLGGLVTIAVGLTGLFLPALRDLELHNAEKTPAPDPGVAAGMPVPVPVTVDVPGMAEEA